MTSQGNNNVTALPEGNQRFPVRQDVPEDLVPFGRRLAVAMERARRTNVGLASELGVSAKLVMCWRTHRRLPSVPMLRALASVLDVSTDFLLALDEPEVAA